MTDRPPKPIDDADQHRAWLHQLDTDPHRIRIDGIGAKKAARYLTWHQDRLAALEATACTLDAAHAAIGTTPPPRPSLDAAVFHHRTMIDRLAPTAALAAVPKPRTLTADQAAQVRAAEVRAYAHKHGISTREAETHMNRSTR